MSYAGSNFLSPLRPQIVSPPPPPLSLLADRYHTAMHRRERKMAKGNFALFLTGLALTAFVLSIAPWLLLKTQHYFTPTATGDAPPITLHILLFIDSLLLLMTLPVALMTAEESRTDSINHYLRSGARSHPHAVNPLSMFLLYSACLGLFHGECFLLDATKTTLLRLRLTGTDRTRAATILAQLHATPAGLNPRLLLRHRENPKDFRKIIAYLMTYQWADLSPNADHLSLLSPTRRALRT